MRFFSQLLVILLVICICQGSFTSAQHVQSFTYSPELKAGDIYVWKVSAKRNGSTYVSNDELDSDGNILTLTMLKNGDDITLTTDTALQFNQSVTLSITNGFKPYDGYEHLFLQPTKYTYDNGTVTDIVQALTPGGSGSLSFGTQLTEDKTTNSLVYTGHYTDDMNWTVRQDIAIDISTGLMIHWISNSTNTDGSTKNGSIQLETNLDKSSDSSTKSGLPTVNFTSVLAILFVPVWISKKRRT